MSQTKRSDDVACAHRANKPSNECPPTAPRTSVERGEDEVRRVEEVGLERRLEALGARRGAHAHEPDLHPPQLHGLGLDHLHQPRHLPRQRLVRAQLLQHGPHQRPPVLPLGRLPLLQRRLRGPLVLPARGPVGGAEHQLARRRVHVRLPPVGEGPHRGGERAREEAEAEARDGEGLLEPLDGPALRQHAVPEGVLARAQQLVHLRVERDGTHLLRLHAAHAHERRVVALPVAVEEAVGHDALHDVVDRHVGGRRDEDVRLGLLVAHPALVRLVVVQLRDAQHRLVEALVLAQVDRVEQPVERRRLARPRRALDEREALVRGGRLDGHHLRGVELGQHALHEALPQLVEGAVEPRGQQLGRRRRVHDGRRQRRPLPLLLHGGPVAVAVEQPGEELEVRGGDLEQRLHLADGRDERLDRARVHGPGPLPPPPRRRDAQLEDAPALPRAHHAQETARLPQRLRAPPGGRAPRLGARDGARGHALLLAERVQHGADVLHQQHQLVLPAVPQRPPREPHLLPRLRLAPAPAPTPLTLAPRLAAAAAAVGEEHGRRLELGHAQQLEPVALRALVVQRHLFVVRHKSGRRELEVCMCDSPKPSNPTETSNSPCRSRPAPR